LKSDFTVEMSPETTEHHVKQLRDIKVNAELDLSMFDVSNYTVRSSMN